MQNPGITIINQYATAPTMLAMIDAFNQWIDPTANLNAFYADMWNVNTAQDYGLDCWGRIVGVTRVLTVASPTAFIGFITQAPTVKPLDWGILFNGQTAATSNYILTDSAFRTLIFAKGLANICNGSIPAMNQILINLFSGQGLGNVYVTDGLNMTMTVTFTNPPSAVQLGIISSSGVFPRPCGVALTVVT